MKKILIIIFIFIFIGCATKSANNKQSIIDSQKQLEELQTQLDKNQEDVNELKKLNEDLRKEKEIILDEKDSLILNNLKIKEDYDSLIKEYGILINAWGDNKYELKETLRQKQKKIYDLQSELGMTKSEAQYKHDSFDNLREKNKSQKKEIAKLKSDLNNTKKFELIAYSALFTAFMLIVILGVTFYRFDKLKKK